MASMVLGTVGSIIGGPIGYVVGTLIGSLIDQSMKDPVIVEGGQLSDLRVQGADPGNFIPIIYGTSVCPGQVIWSTDLIPTRHEEDVGGKGGPTQTNIWYTYHVNFAVAMGEGPLKVIKIWADANLIYDATSTDLTLKGYMASNDIVHYNGSETQLPDPTMESYLGVGNVPAYRGLSYLVFNNFQLERFGNRPPNLHFLVCSQDTNNSLQYNVNWNIPPGALYRDYSSVCLTNTPDRNQLHDEVYFLKGGSPDVAGYQLISDLIDNDQWKPAIHECDIATGQTLDIFDLAQVIALNYPGHASPIINNNNNAEYYPSVVDPSTGKIFLPIQITTWTVSNPHVLVVDTIFKVCRLYYYNFGADGFNQFYSSGLKVRNGYFMFSGGQLYYNVVLYKFDYQNETISKLWSFNCGVINGNFTSSWVRAKDIHDDKIYVIIDQNGGDGCFYLGSFDYDGNVLTKIKLWGDTNSVGHLAIGTGGYAGFAFRVYPEFGYAILIRAGKFYKILLSTGFTSIIIDFSLTDSNTGVHASNFLNVDIDLDPTTFGWEGVRQNAGTSTLRSISGNSTTSGVPLNTIIKDINKRCNVSDNNQDTTEGNSVTVEGFTINELRPASGSIDTLRKAFIFDIVESDYKLKLKLRKNLTSSVTISESELID